MKKRVILASGSPRRKELMKMITEGVMNGNLPWPLVLIGIFAAIVVEILGIPVLPLSLIHI